MNQVCTSGRLWDLRYFLNCDVFYIILLYKVVLLFFCEGGWSMNITVLIFAVFTGIVDVPLFCSMENFWLAVFTNPICTVEDSVAKISLKYSKGSRQLKNCHKYEDFHAIPVGYLLCCICIIIYSRKFILNNLLLIQNTEVLLSITVIQIYAVPLLVSTV
jgi:hypothetical protein